MIWRDRRVGGRPAAVAGAVSAGGGNGRADAGDAFEHQVREAAHAGRFHVHYQPIFSVPDDVAVGVEALLRWDSDFGRVPPGRFVPVLEGNGLIGSVGDWVLATTTREVAGWPASGSGPLLAVNVAARQLGPGFADLVLRRLDEAGFPAGRLCLELTDAARIPDPTAAWAELRRLKASGVRLFVDDFGTAGASIVDLKRFVVDAVKIDGSFVQGIGVHEEDEAIVAALIGLAHSLGMDAIAEWVETADQLDRLRELGCDFAQGLLFGRAGPPADLFLGGAHP